MKKGLTELVFILDRSGSMAGLEDDTIGGFNALIRKQKQEEGEALVSTILFDNRREVLHDRQNIREIAPMGRRDYYVRGSTALLDAVGSAITHISNVHRYIRPEDVPEKTLFVITTDGMENTSREYTYEKVRCMIEKKKEKGWEFLFLGANIDAAREAARFGIGREYAADYLADKRGTGVLYDTVNDAVSHVRCCSAPLQADWKQKVEQDYRKRK